jgi:L-serine deaminase
MRANQATAALAASLVLTAGAATAQTCSSFSNCAEAVKSYNAGNSRLDRDKDGIPCKKTVERMAKICLDNYSR